jgi:hypothetical protein
MAYRRHRRDIPTSQGKKSDSTAAVQLQTATKMSNWAFS